MKRCGVRWPAILALLAAVAGCQAIPDQQGSEGQAATTVFGGPESGQYAGALAALVSQRQIAVRRPLGAAHKIALTVGQRALTRGEIAHFAPMREIGPGELNAFVDGVMTAPGFRGALTYWCNLLLEGMHQYEFGENALNLVSEEIYPNRKWFNAEGIHQGGNLKDVDRALYNRVQRETNTAVMNQPCNLMIYLVENDLPFTGILTADYLVGNEYLELALGLRDYDDTRLPDETLRPFTVEGHPVAGLLTDPVFLKLHPTTRTNVNRHRAWFVLRQFFDTDVLATSSRVNAVPSVDENPTLNAPECIVCHRVMDPIAGTFKNWDAHGRYRPGDWYGDMRAPGFSELFRVPAGQQATALPWVARHMADDPRFALSIVKRFFQIITGNQVALPTDPDPGLYDAQQDFFQGVAFAFWESGYDFRVAIREIVTSPFFLGATSTAPVSNFGSRRVLTPEQLSARVAAVLGRGWGSSSGSTDYLTHPSYYLQILGGNNRRLRALDAMNATFAAVVRRMANEITCPVVADDFSRPRSARSLFFSVDQDTPLQQTGETEAAIAYLYQKVLGLTPSLLELGQQRTALLAIQAAGQAAIAGGVSTRVDPACRRREMAPGQPLPESLVVDQDPEFIVRTWAAYLKALLLRAEFLHE